MKQATYASEECTIQACAMLASKHWQVAHSTALRILETWMNWKLRSHLLNTSCTIHIFIMNCLRGRWYFFYDKLFYKCISTKQKTSSVTPGKTTTKKRSLVTRSSFCFAWETHGEWNRHYYRSITIVSNSAVLPRCHYVY